MATTDTKINQLVINEMTSEQAETNINQLKEHEFIVFTDLQLPLPTTADIGKAIAFTANGFQYVAVSAGGDSVVVGTYVNETTFNDEDGQTVTPQANTLYVDKTAQSCYIWDGAKYAIVSNNVAIGETVGTAYDGAKGKAIADKQQEIIDGTQVVGKSKETEYYNIPSAQVAIATTDWVNNVCTANVDGVKTTSKLFLSPQDDSAQAFISCGITSSVVSNGEVVFTCTTKPTTPINIDLLILG